MNKWVTGISFNWALIEGGKGLRRLSIETPLLNAEQPLAPGERTITNVKNFNISKLFLKGADLGARSWIEILVGNVLYSDGSSWRPMTKRWLL
ncbi:MAG: hypothetical protein C4334_06035 [Pyrinomonas sp.]